jgi:N-acetylglucosaminyl-diphospho-decaprenol L-rhamnosyltransferase
MISIVIVNWNSGPLLEKCIQSLLLHAAGCQIVVVDNASTDSSLHFAEQTKSKILVLRNDRNIGFAAASNMGWRAGEGTHILFLNPDTECFPGSVERMQRALIGDNAIWAAGGQLVSPSGEPQTGFNVRVFPTVGIVAAEMLMIEKIWPTNPWSGPNRKSGEAIPMDVDQPAAACLMVSKTALEKIGGFDEDFFPAWFEDVDLCRRIRNQGGRIRYEPEARFLHHGGYSLSQLSWQEFLEIFQRNRILYFRKHHGRRAASRVKHLIVAGLLLRSGLSLAFPPAAERSRKASSAAYWKAACRISKLRESAL